MKYIVAYDISDNTIRQKVARILTRYGYRIQLSVFYIPEISEAEIELLYKEIRKLVNRKTDRVFFYPVDEIEVFNGYPIEPWNIEVI